MPAGLLLSDLPDLLLGFFPYLATPVFALVLVPGRWWITMSSGWRSRGCTFMQEWTVVSPFAFARLEETTWNLGLVFSLSFWRWWLARLGKMSVAVQQVFHPCHHCIPIIEHTSVSFSIFRYDGLLFWDLICLCSYLISNEHGPVHLIPVSFGDTVPLARNPFSNCVPSFWE